MSAGKKIEVRIAATGGDQAAREVSKAESSVRRLQAEMDRLHENDFSTENEEKIKALETRLEAARERFREVADEAENAADAASDLDENVSNIARVQKAQAIAQLAGQIGTIGTKLKEVSNDVREFDAELAATLQTTGENIEKVSGAVEQMAVGFAVGGPLGAGVMGIGSLLGETANAWIDMERAMSRADRAEAQAVEMQIKLKEALTGGLEAALQAEEASQRLKDSYTETTAAIRDQVSALNDRNRIVDAEEGAASAERDNQDAAAIRSGQAPEEVKARRSMDDAARAKAKIARDLEIKRLEEAERSKEKQALSSDQDALEANPAATPEQIQAGREAERKASEALEKAQRQRVVAEQVAEQKSREIDIRAAGRVTGFQADKEERLKREQDQADRKAQEQERARLKIELEKRQEGLDGTARGASGKFSNAGRFVGGDLGSSLSNIGKKLEDGTNQKEIETLAAQFQAATQGMGGATIAALREMLSTQQKQAKEIETLRGQIKNNY